MFCHKCGKEVAGQDKFCPSCGACLQVDSVAESYNQNLQYVVMEPKKTNIFAILSVCFCWSFLFGLIFGIVGLVQSKKLESGATVSAVGIALSLFLFLFVLYLI